MKVSDGLGNYILVTKEGPFNVLRIDLWLKNKDTPKNLGRINVNNRTFYVRERQSSCFIFDGKVKAYRFCFKFMEQAEKFDDIVIQTSGKKDNIHFTRDFLLKNGHVFARYDQGFTVNIYIEANQLKDGTTQKG